MFDLKRVFDPFSPPDTHFMDRLLYWADAVPDDLVYRYLLDGENEEKLLTYAQLDLRVKSIAAKLASMGMQGQRVLLLFPPCMEFIEAFFGCYFAGAIPVPAYPPRRNRNVGRINAISEDADARAALTVSEVLSRVDGTMEEAPSLKKIPWIAVDQVPIELASDWIKPSVKPDDIGLIQYTSGSTGSPKGVVLTHANILANCNYITGSFGLNRHGSGLSWLPVYHDMGLVGGALASAYVGRHNTFMSPLSFLSKPLRWLQAISKHKPTISGGPNFAYALCIEKIADEDCRGLDLSHWQVAFNGAEPVRADVLTAFSEKFKPFGFRADSHYPCYGMAETTLLVTGGDFNGPPITRAFDGECLDGLRVSRVNSETRKPRKLVGCGRAMPGETVIIVDPETRIELTEDRIGEIWVQSESVGQGYWNKPEISAATFRAELVDRPERGQFLRTGDLGFIDQGELFVTGRLKDMIIVRGVNRYPQDIEATVENASDRLRAGASAAFAVDMDGRERLVIVCEVERSRQSDWQKVLDAVRSCITAQHDLPPDAIYLVRAGSVPKTSSGKIQRHACRKNLEDDKLLIVAKWCEWEQTGDAVGVEPGSNGQAIDDATVSATVAEVVFDVVRRIAKERAKHLDLDTNIVVDLGLDSLERLDIANSLEEIFDGRFPDETLQEIETIREVALAIETHIGTQPIFRGTEQRDVIASDPNLGKDIPEAFYRLDRMPEYLRLQRTRDRMNSTELRDPYFSVHQGLIADTTMIGDRQLISFSSYNYLGLSGHPEVSSLAKSAIDEFGTSVSASRLVSGEKTIHRVLEHEMAQFLGTEAVLIFAAGHATNESVIGHLVSKGDLVLHDALAHNSIIQGAELSGARRRPFEHNDWEQLDKILTEIRHQYRRVLIAIEGLYSMDGDYPDLPRFVEIKKKHKSWLFVDEAHSIGTLGKNGRGLGELLDVPRADVDVWMGTLSKAFGSFGGFIAGTEQLIDFLKYTTPGFVFAAGMPPGVAGAALGGLRMMQAEPERIEKLKQNSNLFLSLAKKAGLNTGFSHDSPIIPLVTGDSLLALRLSNRMFDRGINVQPILHPAVDENLARLRFFITSCHNSEQIETAVRILKEEFSFLTDPKQEVAV
jgi:8-amino-7-oxononanoate synthase/acyl carrier protein